MDAILCVDDDRAGLATVARTLREVAPATSLGVHAGKVIVAPDGEVTRDLRAAR